MAKYLIRLDLIKNVSFYEGKTPWWHILKIEYLDGSINECSCCTYERTDKQYARYQLLETAYNDIKNSFAHGKSFVEISL